MNSTGACPPNQTEHLKQFQQAVTGLFAASPRKLRAFRFYPSRKILYETEPLPPQITLRRFIHSHLSKLPEEKICRSGEFQ